MDDILMMYFAKTLAEYCDNRDCEGCPFNTQNITERCKIATPAYWDIYDKPLDFPNSN